jgi:(1->4)-alpha-D-glucan 1-alpha-D-glucosylmutase
VSEVRLTAGEHIPLATYRVQLHKDFTFADATALIPYLAELGISHIYCSPYLRARSGSRHGYDIIDHLSLNPEIGTQKDYDAFVDTLHAYGMKQILDVVPNHMGVMGADNQWWQDVLEHGRASPYAQSFDIDWEAPSADLQNRLLLPVLGDHYGKVLNSGQLELRFENERGSFAVYYFQHRFPIDPRLYPRLLEPALRDKANGRAVAEKLSALIDQFAALPERDAPPGQCTSGRSARANVCKQQLAQLVEAEPSIGQAIARALSTYRGTPDQSGSYDALHDLLEAQAYRLAYWRVASDEINYRRFFDINDLAALRMEDAATFERTHRLIFDLIGRGAVDGLRIDHPDGLYDPASYLANLQQGAGERGSTPLYVQIEKIIAPFESIPESWPVYGTTGYRFANLVGGLFVDTSQRNRFTRVYQHFIGDASSFEEIASRSKRLVLRTTMASELTMLATRLLRIARADRSTRDYTLNTLRLALSEVIAAFPVYRTYIRDSPSPEDRRYIEWAVSRARRQSQAADLTIFDFVKSALLCELGGPARPALQDEVRRFAGKFQQITPPVTAKGVEDTAFYIYNRLVSLNEVGGDPAGFGVAVSAFHGASADRAEKWPYTMLATSTHDSKRSEDVRCRISVLSESPAAWRLLLRRWSRMNRSRKVEVEQAPAPSRNDEYLIYQTLIGTLPADADESTGLAAYRERIEAYMVKAAREAKTHTSWINPNPEYEAAALQFIQGLLAETDRNLFLADLRSTLRSTAWYGMLNSFSQVLLKLTSPGVPDIYQGNDTWDFSLVDPDNRRPVDYALRRQALSDLSLMLKDGPWKQKVTQLFSTLPDPRTKLYFVWRLLQLRKSQRALFMNGSYTPLKIQGRYAEHVVAFARRNHRSAGIVVAGRLFSKLGIDAGRLPCGPVWGDTRIGVPFLADGTRVTDWLNGQVHQVREGGLRMAEVWADIPGAVLIHGGEEQTRELAQTGTERQEAT